MSKASSTHSIVFIVAIICTIINVGILLLHPSFTEVTMDVASLQRPNQYIGLSVDDFARTNATPPTPFINFPPLLTQISKAKPHYVFPDDPHRWFSWEVCCRIE
jgi:hypothetical protein